MQLMGLIKGKPKEPTFEELIQQQLDNLYHLALRFTRNPDNAQDLVNDTVVRALRFQSSFEMGTNFKAWISKILYNTFVHGYRRKKREREILTGASRGDVVKRLHSDESFARSTAPENSYLESMLSDDIVHALDSLSEDFRTVVVLCDVEGLSYKEIAEIIDCPVGTVMSRLYRARRVLQSQLQSLALERGIIKSDSEADVIPMDRYRA